jgi:hypothetical protein
MTRKDLSFDDWIKVLTELEEAIATCASSSVDQVTSSFSLVAIAQHFKTHEHMGRFFAALTDFKLIAYYVSADFQHACGVYNEQLHPKVKDTKNANQLYASRILFLRDLNAFVLRARSLWDKALGLMVLAYLPDQYESFVTADSRRAKFKQLMHGVIDSELITGIDQTIGILDEKFRTAEAHQAGTLRSWILPDLPENLIETPFGWLLGAHTDIHALYTKLQKILCRAK